MKNDIKKIIDSTLEFLELGSEDAASLIFATGMAESGYRCLIQKGGGPALGFFQCEPATAIDIYNNYVKDYSDIEKSLFTDICHEFNMMIIDYILEGKEFNMGNNLSTLSIIRRDRDPRSPRLDWGESNKYKKQLLEEGQLLYNAETGKGVKWHIYHTDEFYCKYYWRKGKCKIKNKSVYRFDATRGIKGNKEKLINLLKTDDLAYLKFKKQ